MKFGVSLWLWTSPVTNHVIESFVPKIAEMGFDTIELPLEDPEQLDCSAARKVIEDHGLDATTCAAMGGGRDLIHPDENVRVSTMAYMKASVDAAEQVGSTKFVGPLYAEVGRLWQSTEAGREAETRLLVSQLQELSDYAQSKGVTLCLEALNRFETSFLNLTSQVVEVVDRVNHPACKVMIDLFHAGIEEKSLAEAIRLAGHRLHHLQVAENDRGTPGTGQFAWGEIASALRDVDYDGHIIIETFSKDNELLARAAAIWRPLAESPDALAMEGLGFLKELFK